MRTLARALWAIAAIVVIGGISSLFLSPVTFKDDLWAALAPRLQLMLVMAVIIERAVEVYLYATEQNGPDRFKAVDQGQTPNPPATRAAIFCALVLGVIVSIVGVRLLDSIVDGQLGALHSFLWEGVDVLVSAGLLAGGSALVHEVMELLRGSINLGSQALARRDGQQEPSGAKDSSSLREVPFALPQPPTEAAIETASLRAEYQVSVTRTGTDSGRLEFNEAGVSVSTTCWWDPAVRIASGTYLGCSATRMATKTDSVTGLPRPGIYLPTAIAPDTGNATIFIHEGRDASWSDGCIVIDRNEMMRIWNVIEQNARNVTVHVS